MDSIVKLIQKKKYLKYFILFNNDFIVCVTASYFSLILRYESFQLNLNQFFYTTSISFFCYIFLVYFLKIYSQLHRYFNFNTIRLYLNIFKYYLILLFTVVLIANLFVIIPRSYPIINTTIFFILLILNRSLIPIFLKEGNNLSYKKKCLVYGSKKSISRFLSNISNNFYILGIILLDDESISSMNSIKIFKEHDISFIVKSKNINTFIIALDENISYDKNKFLKLSFDFNISLLSFDTNNNFSNISNQIDIDSLLFRNEVYENIDIDLNGEKVLVTGGAGSIGSEITFQLLKYNPSEIIILDNSEINIFNFNKKLNSLKNKKYLNTKINSILCDISNIDELNYILSENKIDRVYHCAAYKHVPIVENNIFKALKNNFISTYELLNLLINKDIKKFTLISSDKAVRPTNFMGASKRLAELTVLHLNKVKKHSLQISIVRFGNVLNSSGSVVPEFKEQILSGGPVTVTHPEITRYFMSLEEAALLVIQSSQLSKGGEIFLLDMGNPIKINDLAKKMIKLSGNSIKNSENDYGDIEIIYTGLRPGEKLYEELLVDKNSIKTSHKFIYQSIEEEIDAQSFENLLKNLKVCIELKDLNNLKLLLENRFISYKNVNTPQ